MGSGLGPWQAVYSVATLPGPGLSPMPGFPSFFWACELIPFQEVQKDTRDQARGNNCPILSLNHVKTSENKHGWPVKSMFLKGNPTGSIQLGQNLDICPH